MERDTGGDQEQLARDNHFVPRFMLRYWTDSEAQIWVCRLLVTHPKVPMWTRKSVDQVAFRRDLYTLTSGGAETDAFERWIASEFETPAASAVEKAVNGDPLLREDWAKLAMLFAVQDVRTPASFVESVRRWGEQIPDLLNSTLKRSLAEVKKARKKGKTLEPPSREDHPFADVFQVTITPPADGETHGKVEAAVMVGRKLWIASQQIVLEGAARHLPDHKWSVAAPAPGSTWFTSDHPAVRLNYYSEGKYDFKGGWGRRKGDLMMPLAPRAMLFTTIGEDLPDRFTFSAQKTMELQQILAQRAHRAVFANRRIRRVEWLRPRHVDAAMFHDEQQQWAQWHRNQSQAE